MGKMKLWLFNRGMGLVLYVLADTLEQALVIYREAQTASDKGIRTVDALGEAYFAPAPPKVEPVRQGPYR